MLRYGLFVLFAFSLAGCATPEERAARAQAEMDEMIRVYSPACEKLGYAKDSDKWRDCIMKLGTRDDYRRRPATMSCVGQQGYYNCMTY